MGITSTHSLEQPLPPCDQLTLKSCRHLPVTQGKESASQSLYVSYSPAHINKQFIPRGADQVSEVSRPTQPGRDSASYRAEKKRKAEGSGLRQGRVGRAGSCFSAASLQRPRELHGHLLLWDQVPGLALSDLPEESGFVPAPGMGGVTRRGLLRGFGQLSPR